MPRSAAYHFQSHTALVTIKIAVTPAVKVAAATALMMSSTSMLRAKTEFSDTAEGHRCSFNQFVTS